MYYSSFPLSNFLILVAMEKTLFIHSLRDGLEFFHLPIEDASLERYFRYYELLLEWNSLMNLVSARDMDRFVEYHILDSLKILTCADYSGCSRILDFGSGAGLPGIPLSLALPDVHVTLVDSLLKRTRFLEAAVSSLGLTNVTVVRARAEEIPISPNATFDCIVTRATVTLLQYFRLCSRFTAPNGFMVSIKGDHISDELSGLQKALKNTVINMRVCDPQVPESVRKGTVITLTGF